MAVSFNSYYLYKKYEKRGDQPWLPVYPETLSIDGDGSMPKVLKTSGDPVCYIEPEERWVDSGDYACEEITTQYRWVTVSGGYECSGTTKMTQEKEQVSYDRGSTWSDVTPLVTRAALPVIESFSQDCGYIPPTRWTPSGTTCVGTSKYHNNIKEQSLDGGETWSVVIPEEYSASTLISYFSDECGYTPFNGKFKVTNVNGTVATAACNYSSSLTRNEVSGYSSSAKTIEIGNCVTTIDQYTFGGMYEFRKLIAVYIPNSVTKIEKGAFSSCYNLISADIPSGVTSIGGSAYSDCYKITEIKIPTGVTRLENDTFVGCRSLTNVVIPNSVTYIGDGTFAACTGLTSVTLPDGLTHIGQEGFINCWSLTSFGPKGSGASIELPSGVTSLSDAVFAYNAFSAITIPNTVTSIGNWTFEGGIIESITIPSTVRSIGNQAFCESPQLRSLIVESTTPPSAGDEMLYHSSNCTIYVPSGSVNAYKSASGWSTYANRIQAIP